MTVLLSTSRAVNPGIHFDDWVAITPPDRMPNVLNPALEKDGLEARLEEAFDVVAPDWWAIGRSLSADPSAYLAHTPACVANASDFGLMLAWSYLVRAWAEKPDFVTLIVCDDPWLFRHLAKIAGVSASGAPNIFAASAYLWLRGFAARCSVAAQVVRWAWHARRQRTLFPRGRATLLVYGHPVSTPLGDDGYFGDLLRQLPHLVRMLHVDCPWQRAAELAQDGRTFSLHAFANPLFAIMLPFARWRPAGPAANGPAVWLVRRAAAKEGGTGQAAMIRWQQHCQNRWLRIGRPGIVAWPWENHSWERCFVVVARTLRVATLGYQHSVVGRQMLNYSAASNAHGADGLPDRIFCSGASTRDQLASWGVPGDRLAIAGGLRVSRDNAAPALDRAAPIFVALPFDGAIAGQMIAAVRNVALEGSHRFVVKDHPMTPYQFAESQGVERTNLPLGKHASLAGVIYAATTVGLEAILARLPTFRFRPKGRIALDILPEGVTVPAVQADNLAEILNQPSMPPTPDPIRIFAPMDISLWRDALTISADETF